MKFVIKIKAEKSDEFEGLCNIRLDVKDTTGSGSVGVSVREAVTTLKAAILR